MKCVNRVAISQSNYIPWKGYFDLIASVDMFVIYDDMQYTRRDWRNRNQIKTPNGKQWLTIPVDTKGKFLQSIRETVVANSDWQTDHWRSIAHNYKRASCFKEIESILAPLYASQTFGSLSAANVAFIKAICSYLGIQTEIRSSWDYLLVDGKTERLVSICSQVGASVYVSGPAAKSYIDETMFNEAGVSVDWFSYEGYVEYPQLWNGFDHSVSIVDLLCNCGKDSKQFMRFV